MKHVLIVLFIALSIVLVTNTEAGSFDRGLYFTGLWQGIDPIDSGEMLRSITRNRDGTFLIIGMESYFIGCDGDRGKVVGAGVLDGNVIVSSDLTLICYGDDYFDDTDDELYPCPMEIEADRFNRTIIEDYESPMFPSAVLHKVSSW
jgi:hypothetical protein